MPLERLETRGDIVASRDLERIDFDAEIGRCFPHLAQVQLDVGIVHIGQDRHPAQAGYDVAQEFKSLAGSLGGLARQSSDVAARSPLKPDIVLAGRNVRLVPKADISLDPSLVSATEQGGMIPCKFGEGTRRAAG